MTDRQRRFCEEYLVDMNAKNAALRAGYTAATANCASIWINPERPSRPALREEIDRLMASRSRRTGVSADRVVRELARIAFADIADVVESDGSGVRSGLSRDDSAAVQRVRKKQTRDGVECDVRMHDKNRALELLGKHLGIFTENLRVEQVTPVIVDEPGGKPNAPGEPDEAPGGEA